MEIDLESGISYLLESGTRLELETPSTDVPTIPPTKHDGIKGKYYPEFFPCPTWAYAERQSSYQRRTRMESGWKRQRKSWPQFGRALDLQWVMGTDEFDNWSVWMEANGYDWFYLYLDDYGSGKVPELIRLSTDISFRYNNYDKITATATGEVYREGAILNPDCVPPYFINQPGIADDGTAQDPYAYYDKIKEIAARRNWTVAMWIFDDGTPRAADPVPYNGAWDYGDPNGIGSPFDLTRSGTEFEDVFSYGEPSLTGDRRASMKLDYSAFTDGSLTSTIDFGPLVNADGSWTMSMVIGGVNNIDNINLLGFINSSNQGGWITYDKNRQAIAVFVVTAIGGDTMYFPVSLSSPTVIIVTASNNGGKLAISAFADGAGLEPEAPIDDVSFEKPFTPYTFTGLGGGNMQIQYGWMLAGAVSIPEVRELWSAWEKTKEF
jgi:hypothetical protein